MNFKRNSASMGALVARAKFLGGLRGLRGSKYFLRGSRFFARSKFLRGSKKSHLALS